ncbi:MAG: 4Fe-4S binding protein [Desulfobacteraceae bacterium]|nr:4Fe-4S binding protein [Desulfobacteraceae bacterium]MBC2754989.1 4Fe-4S binding protein [Desulfobacteraceae bacterium]
MKIAIASGKGGTGKTTVASSLISVWESPVIAMDLDVEEPNLHLFLKPTLTGKRTANMEIPKADDTLCSKCGKCGELCQFKAISLMGEILMIFPEMCHGCGGCIAICPEGALTTEFRELGEVTWGQSRNAEFLMGRLRVGEAMSPPLMRAVKEKLEEMMDTASKDVIPKDVIIDAPPGVSCPAINAVMDSDVILLVTEPTPFGFYDMKLAHEAFFPMGKPMGVIVNRAGLGNAEVYDYCAEKELDIMAEIPYDRQIAETYARGSIISESSDEIKQIFISLAEKIKQKAGSKKILGGVL